LKPPGPARADEIAEQDPPDEAKELPKRVRSAVGGGHARIYSTETGVCKAEIYVAGLDADGEKIIAAIVTVA
jgi:hypothetical protein